MQFYYKNNDCNYNYEDKWIILKSPTPGCESAD